MSLSKEHDTENTKSLCQTESPEPSCVSMKSDESMISPTNFSLGDSSADLSLSSCGITEEGCAALASALRSNPSHLRELNLNCNKPGDSAVKLLSTVLEDSRCKLQKLELRGCSIGEEGCAALASALRSNPSHLRELSLNNNNPGDSGVKLLSAVLEDSRCKLEKLDFNAESPGHQPDNTFEVVLENGSFLKCQSNEKMDKGMILNYEEDRLYYKVMHNGEYIINFILDNAYIPIRTYINNEHNLYNFYLSSEINDIFKQLIIEESSRLKKDITSKQYGYIWLKRKNGKFKRFGPFSGKHTGHSEDHIIEKLLEIFDINDLSDTFPKHTDYTDCFIYSTNSPCLCKNNRELKDRNPCMINLFYIMVKLAKIFDTKFHIGFLNFWGFFGSFKKNLLDCPIKQNNFKSDDLNNKTNKIQKQNLIQTIQSTFITELENKPFKIEKDLCTKKKTDMQKCFDQFFWKLPITNKSREREILFQLPDSEKTFNEFVDDGLKKINKFKENVTTAIDNNLSDDQKKFYTDFIFKFSEWWDENVKKAFSSFLNEHVDDYLKKCSFQLFLNNIPDTINKNFIGCLKDINEHS